MKRRTMMFMLVILTLLLGACVPVYIPTQAQQPVDQNAVATAAVQTVQARLTEVTMGTLVSKLTEVSKATASPLPATATLLPSSTTAPSATPLPPTNTPTVTNTPRPPTATPKPATVTATAVPCNWAKFVADVTVPDGTSYKPAATFTKTWRLKNIGSCTWTTDYDLVFDSGNAMSAPAKVGFEENVRPGETVDLSVKMVSPDKTGTFKGYWKLRSANGITFGIGADADSPFWVQIVVSKPVPTQDTDEPVNFIKRVCYVTWKNQDDETLPCPGDEDFTHGAIYTTNKPKLEGGYQDDEPTIVMIPGYGDDGSISGRYSAFTIQSGDRFTAVIGCLDASPKCNVVMELRYSIGTGSSKLLKSWKEVSDKSFRRVEVDLSSLDGEMVHLWLVVRSNGSNTDDRAFWLAPAILR